MTYKIFEIRGVTDEEVNEVRYLLQKNKIRYYETPKGNFGRSMATIWVSDNSNYLKARKVIDEYQKKFKSRNKSNNINEIKHTRKYSLYAVAIFIFVIVIWRLFYGISFF